jgi:hypothetical protein
MCINVPENRICLDRYDKWWENQAVPKIRMFNLNSQQFSPI